MLLFYLWHFLVQPRATRSTIRHRWHKVGLQKVFEDCPLNECFDFEFCKESFGIEAFREWTYV